MNYFFYVSITTAFLNKIPNRELKTAVNTEFTRTKGKAILGWTKMLLSKKGCSQVLKTKQKPNLKVAEHSFQVPMPNSLILLNYLWFGARFLQESRLTTERLFSHFG